MAQPIGIEKSRMLLPEDLRQYTWDWREKTRDARTKTEDFLRIVAQAQRDLWIP